MTKTCRVRGICLQGRSLMFTLATAKLSIFTLPSNCNIFLTKPSSASNLQV